MPKKNMTFSIDTNVGGPMLAMVARELKRSKSNTVETLIEEAALKLLKEVNNEDRPDNL